jgi:hypothetical protein
MFPHPQPSPFYRSIERLYPEFEAADERHQERYGVWRPIIGTVVRKFLECGDRKHRFARVRCPKGREELLRVTFAGPKKTVLHPISTV